MLQQPEGMLPQWLAERVAVETGHFPTHEARMRLVIEWSSLNVEQGTGGPFGAGVFDMDTGRLIAAGVNRVVSLNDSTAHAEMLAIAGAQQKLASFDLGAEGMPRCELVSSCEPCAMCFGAIPWSGITSVVCGASAEDAERIGFDEGPRHPQWVAELEKRGIRVQIGVCRADATQVLAAYQATGGLIYNGGQV